MTKFKIHNRLWISTSKGTFLGEGRVKLLEEIDQCGSISKAADKMDMSYKKAWILVKSMNEQFNKPLVIRKIGGKEGGGSVLTEDGKKCIKTYNQLNEEWNTFIQERIKTYKIL